MVWEVEKRVLGRPFPIIPNCGSILDDLWLACMVSVGIHKLDLGGNDIAVSSSS